VLAEDPRVAELALTVELVSGKLQVTGTVASQARRDAIETVLQERFPGLGIVDKTETADMTEAETPEAIS
jgi:hypothetical protein